MREILFRGKRVDNGEWIKGGYAENGGKTFIIVRTRYIPDTRDWDTVEYYKNNPCYHLSMIEVDPETVCQYTGLTDKNGRKIFKGDICKYYNPEDKEGVAIIEDDYANWISGKIREKELLTPLFYLKCGKEWEIIGNIYDNPKLIGEQP